MKLETFFEKFDLFTDAPDAIGKMRELVLELAVQGKLVDQKRSDGNAKQLLAAISHERETLAAKLRTPSEPASAEGDEPTFPIPSNWTWTQLGNIALQIQYGYTASADASATEIRMLRITDIQNNRVDWPSVPGCQIESAEAEKYLLSPNDILIARTGGTIGKSFIVPDAPVKSVFASYLIRVTPPQSIAARYLKTFLESPLYWSQLRQMSAGTGQPNVNGQALGRLEIPLPPLAEQKRIVAKVDELMALCDRLEAQQQERETRHAALARASLARFADAPTPANLDFIFHKSYDISPADLRKSILTLAVQGKLVPQDPNDEPAQPAVDQIERERERLIAAKQFRRSQLPGQIDEGPFDIPETWVWTHLGNAMLNVTDGFHSTPKTVESGVPYVTAKHVKPGLIDFDSCLYVSEDDFKEIASKTRPRKGDVLVVNIGAGSGLASIIQADFEFAFKNVAILNRPEEVDPKFLFNYLVFKRDDIFEEQTKGGAQPFLSLGLIRQIPFPLPPLAEQRRIVAKVEQLMALVDVLETQLAASRTTAANLLSALVAELTTQD